MYSVKRFSVAVKGLLDKFFAHSSNVKKNIKDWEENIQVLEESEAADYIRHPDPSNRGYSKYIPVWINPETREMIIDFEFSYERLDVWEDDLLSIDSYLVNTVSMIQESMENRGLVFVDDDDFIDENYGKPGPFKKWDTKVHLLSKFIKPDKLVFSKDISRKHRLTYAVYKPKKIGGKWVCKVEYSRCYGHHYGDEEYDMKNSETTIADSTDIETRRKLRDMVKNGLFGILKIG